MDDNRGRLRKVWLAAGLAAGFVIGLAGTVGGQDVHKTFWQEEEEARSDKALRFGPLRLFPVIQISELGYDSNVYYSENRVVSDFVATPSPSLKAYMLFGSTVIMSFTENPEYNFFVKESQLRAFTNSYSAALRLRLPGGFVLSGSYDDSSHIRRAYDELEGRIKDKGRGLKLNAFWETWRGTSLGVAYSETDYTYAGLGGDDTEEGYNLTLDRTEKTGYAEFDYRIFTQSYLFLRAGVSKYEFDYAVSAWRDSKAYKAVAGLRLPLTGRARGSLTIGWKKFMPDSPDRKVFSSLVGDGSVDFRIGRFGLNAGYVRDIYFSYLDQAFYYVENRVKGGLSFYLTEFLRIDYNKSYSRMSYPEPVSLYDDGVLVTVDSRLDRVGSDQVGLVVRVSGSFGLGVNMNFYRRDSNAPGYNINRNFLGAYLTYDF